MLRRSRHSQWIVSVGVFRVKSFVYFFVEKAFNYNWRTLTNNSSERNRDTFYQCLEVYRRNRWQFKISINSSFSVQIRFTVTERKCFFRLFEREKETRWKWTRGLVRHKIRKKREGWLVAFAKNPALRVRVKAENASSFLTCAAGLIFSIMRELHACLSRPRLLLTYTVEPKALKLYEKRFL